MKKTYIAPFCKIREVKKCNIIATSGELNDSVGDGHALSRGWDDDDWDED